MTDIIELNEVVTDTTVRELRVGDMVQLELEESMIGTVTEITAPEGDLYVEHGLNSITPPTVTVRFNDGRVMVFDTEFLRVSLWRFQALALRKL